MRYGPHKGYGRLDNPLTRELREQMKQLPGAAAMSAQSPTAKAKELDLRSRMVRLTQGFYSQMPSINAAYVDRTEEVLYDYDTAATGPVAVLEATVPSGRIWLIDDFEFFAKRLFPFPRLIPAGDLEEELDFSISAGGDSNIDYSFRAPYGQTNSAKIAFMYDRLGSVGAGFGIWLRDGETFRAEYRVTFDVATGNPGPGPTQAVRSIGFRLRAYQGELASLSKILEEQK